MILFHKISIYLMLSSPDQLYQYRKFCQLFGDSKSSQNTFFQMSILTQEEGFLTRSQIRELMRKGAIQHAELATRKFLSDLFLMDK